MPLPPLVAPALVLDGAERERTARHLSLAGFGESAQQRLAAAHIAIVGAGGLGSPAVIALAAAGVGTLTVIDDDTVELSNLQRQVLHRRGDVGARKVDSAVRAAAELSSTRVITHATRLTAANAADLLLGADVVLDGTDTFETRAAVAAATESLGVPLVWGVVQEFHAQVTVFWSRPPAGVRPVVLADLYPAETTGEPPSCAEVGVLGALTLQAGALMAIQAISLVTGVGEPLLGRIALIDALRGTQAEIPLNPAAVSTAVSPAPATAPTIPRLSPAELRAAVGATVLDVREPAETATGVIPGAALLPLGRVLDDPALAGTGPFIVVCGSGGRALRAARVLAASGAQAAILDGGMKAWRADAAGDMYEPSAAEPAACALPEHRTRTGTRAMITVEEHLATVLAAVRPVSTLYSALTAAHGWTLAAAVTARVDIPVFDNSSMDGFAVRVDDLATLPARLTVVADVPAGADLDPSIGPGQAVRIMTGAPLPSQATAIVPFESTVGGLADSLGEIVVTLAPTPPGVFIRRRGGDAEVGDAVLPAGVVFGPLQAAAAAAAGVDQVVVARMPRVAIVSTGSELIPPGRPLRRGQIPESNSELLAGLVVGAGAELVLRASIDDGEHGASHAVADALAAEADVVVFTGGVSAGAYEPVKQGLGHTMRFVQVAMQPGKPQGFGATGDGMLLFGLPGNPVSAAVSFETFVRPALLAMQGRDDLHRPVLRMAAASAWRTPPARRQYLPVRIDRADPGAWRAVPATSGASHLAGGLGGAEGYAVVPADVDRVEAGDPVDVMLIA